MASVARKMVRTREAIITGVDEIRNTCNEFPSWSRKVVHLTRSTIEVRHFFFLRFHNFGSLRSPPNTDLEKNKKPLLDETCHGLGYGTRTRQKNGVFPTISVIQKPFRRNVIHLS